MRALPVTDAVAHAVRSTSDNIGFAFHISWPWMLVLLPVTIVGNLFVAARTIADSGQPDSAAIAAALAMTIPTMLAFASIAVSWHRYILLDEVPQGWKRLRLDETVWRYFGNGLLIALVVGAGVAAAGFGVSAIAAVLALVSPALAALVAVPGTVAIAAAAIAAFYRLSIKLPAVALERRDYGLAQAWRDSEGNFWRFVGFGLLLAAIFFAVLLAAGVLGFGLGLVDGAIAESIAIAIQVAISWGLAVFGVTVLTSLYGFFVERRDF
jgi:hypothetical protein